MGKGIDMARADAPEHAALMDDLKDQLIIVLLKRLGPKVSIPISEVDDTGMDLVAFNVENGAFNFEVRRKQ